MKRTKEKVYEYLYKCCIKEGKDGLTTNEIAQALSMQRSNVSAVLNDLYHEGRIFKIKGKPVLYTVKPLVEGKLAKNTGISFENLIGKDGSLKKCIQLAKAAILYPPSGLHVLLLGPTGVGKTMFAELMYKFALEKGVFSINSPFIAFNCADYANNPQLLLSQLFGYKKGAFTGAEKDKPGLVEKADGGILFLDEIHRLPPEGQEMLFTLIDKGIYYPMGADEPKIARVLIIGATTESEGNALLSTFTRRIPITITIPSLKERPFEERFQLICQFFKIEAARIGRDMTVTANVIKGLMLYDCPGNIGQLKSDIQLGCANAFLKCVSRGKKKIEVDIADFSERVKKGLVFYKNFANEIDVIIKGDVKLNFSSKEGNFDIEFNDSPLPGNFYEEMEKRVLELKEHGIDEKEINFIMSLEMENYFKKYIRTFSDKVDKESISKIVDRKLINLVDEFLKSASMKLGKVFSSKVFYGLCLHLSASIKRIKKGKKIINHKLKEIIEKKPEEYAMALYFSKTLEQEYGIKVPVDEVGFIAMFLCIDSENEVMQENVPVVVIAMHGNSTASSMAEVANKLVGANNLFSYDMSLEKDPKVAYVELKELIMKVNRGAGVLLLVDMGSLAMFGELISEETGIKIRVLEMVTTIMAIECARKATILKDLDEICSDVLDSIEYFKTKVTNSVRLLLPKREKIIITICTTGEGSAVKLKNLIEEKLGFREDIQVVPISASDSKYVQNYINQLSKDKKILAIVGAINPNVYGIPFVSVSELLIDNSFERLKELVASQASGDIYKEVFDSLKEEIGDGFSAEAYKKLCAEFFKNIERYGCFRLDMDKRIGLIMHIACSIDRLRNGMKINSSFADYKKVKAMCEDVYEIVKKELARFENVYDISFPEEEAVNISAILKDIVLG
ncbi:sigma 54-interacting transcriptional regulator [Caldanaerovirga acetigignens]|uniref:sigma 54-interacting transcriptional regulator n=1 Tax=Caldanaerovirga acetigignens TaxID=447595 RepID=UPI000934F3E8|nr:sigma-54-dependent transcriptional regulator [Caldanaerovirga acetigignens]